MSQGKRWTRDELLVALNIYHKLPFSMFDAKRRAIIELAAKLGRTPGSLAMKLGNLASLDPVQQLRGVKGLEGASNFDREMWAEFHARSETLGPVRRPCKFLVEPPAVVEPGERIGDRENGYLPDFLPER